MKLVILNGPPHSGKDTIATTLQEILKRKGNYVEQYKFAGPMKKALKAFFGLSAAEYTKYFESDAKNLPQEKFFGMTPRGTMISFSENWAKEVFGKEVFGRLAGQYIMDMSGANSDDIIIITDCGFEEELQGLFKYIGPKNCLIYRLMREGTSYANDSRSWIMNEDVFSNKILQNNSKPEDAVEVIFKDLVDIGATNEQDEVIPF